MLHSQEFWRPQRDLNPCYRLERPASLARLDDGDKHDEPRRARTVDHRIKSPVLYQLSYRPVCSGLRRRIGFRFLGLWPRVVNPGSSLTVDSLQPANSKHACPLNFRPISMHSSIR
jgi:hypothetical protein